MKKPKKLPSPYKFADGGPLHDRDINGKLLQSTYASALGNMFREGGPFGEDQGVFDYATSIYASQPGNYYAQGGMIKRADGSYSQRGLWDNIRAAAARNRAAGKPGKEPSEEMLRQGEKINREYRTGGQFPRPYSLPEDSFKQGGTNLHNSVYASSSAPYPGIYAEGGALLPPDNAPAAKENQQALEAERLNNIELLKTMTPEQKAAMRAAGLTPAQYLADPFSAGATKFAEGGKLVVAGGEKHRIYKKTSPTGNGEGMEGHIMVNHPTIDKGQWDTIDLTTKAGAKTVADGIAATKQWHKENPNQYAEGGMLGGPGDPVKPIYVTNPNDPRLLAHNDSLSLYNKTQDIQNPKYYTDGDPSWYNWKGTRQEAEKFMRKNNIDLDYEYYRTGKFPGKIQPIKIGYFGEGMAYPIYEKPVQSVIYQPEIKLPTKKLPQKETEIIPNNYNYIPQKYKPIQVANRSQTIMEADPDREGKYRIKEMRQVPYSAYFPGEGWQPANAPRVLYIDSKGNEVEERPKEFKNGGSILSMSNTPQLEGEGKDLTYPNGAYVYNYGGKLFAPGGPIYPTNQQLAQFLNPEYQRVTQGQEVTVRPNAYQMQQAKNKAAGINKYDAINIKPQVAESTKPNIAPVDKKILDKAIAQKTAERKVVAKEIKNSPLLTQEQKQEILMSPQKLDENAHLAYQKNPDVLKEAKEYTAADKATNILRNPLVAASYFMKPGAFNMPMNYSEFERSPNYSDETWNRNAAGQGLNAASYLHPAGLALHMADNALYTATDLDKALESGKTEDWKQAGLSTASTILDLLGSRYIGGSGRLLNAGEQATLNAMNTSNRLGLNPSVNNFLSTRVFPNINSSVVRSADDIATARLFPQINPNNINYNPLARNLYNNAVTAGNVQNALEAVQSTPFDIDELRRVYHNAERYLTPDEQSFLSQQGRGEAATYLSEANRASPSTISPDEFQEIWRRYESDYSTESKNKSGLTKEEALKKVAAKDKDILAAMNSTDFENTVLKPTGEVVQYKPRSEVSQIIDDTALKQMRLVDQVPMTSEEYADAFNERLDLLNDIIAQRNKSGVEYRVTGLTPHGKLEFYTPKQTVTRQMSEKRTAEYNNYLQDPEKFITERAGLRQNNSGKWVFNDDISTQRFNTKEEALDWAKADIEQLIGPEISEIEGTSDWTVNIKPGQWRGEVEDIANAEYYSNIPGLNMSMTSRGVFSDSRPRKGSGAYESINEYLKQLDLGRVKPGFNSQTDFSRGAWENFIKSGRAYGYYANPSTVYGTMKKNGGVIETNQEQFKMGGQARVIKSSQLFNR